LKTLIKECVHTSNLKFPSQQPIVLAVDSSWYKFNSLLTSKRQQRYSQPKHKLCSLMRALQQEEYLLRGCKNMIIETDTKYLYGMLNNPGKMPNTTINRWVDYIRTAFFFEIRHRKEKTFRLDSLSRQ
jgi:hypothetical protein